jgi:pyruvate,water dikinase
MTPENEVKSIKERENTNTYVIDFQKIDKSKFMDIGGKGANLGELSAIKGIQKNNRK